MHWPKILASIALSAVIACSLAADSSVAAVTQSQASSQLRCPETEATRAFLRANPQWLPVTIDMLVHDDRDIWNAVHPHDCPGVAEIAYDGDGAPMALALVRQAPDGSREQWLVVVGSN